jgi:hypothetical protein
MDQIFDLSFHGQGGFPFEQVYQMPVNVRSYYYAKLAGILKERAEQMEAAQKNKGRR